MRNITAKGNSFRVQVKRANDRHYGGAYASIDDAITARDQLEARLGPPLRPYQIKNGGRPPRTMGMLIEERKAAGLCPKCGKRKPKYPGGWNCEDCLRYI